MNEGYGGIEGWGGGNPGTGTIEGWDSPASKYIPIV